MRLRVDLAQQDFLGAGKCHRRHLAAQFLAGTVRLGLDFGLCRGDLPLTFLRTRGLAVGEDFVRARVGLVKDACRLAPGIGNDLFGLGACLLQLLFAAIGGGEALFDLLLPFLDGIENRRPEELHAEDHEDDHRDRLADEG